MTRPRDDMGDVEGEADASRAVTALYESHALGLTRLAFIMLGDRYGAEDVVQEAFCGLYRAWDRLPDHDNVLGYLRTAVVQVITLATGQVRQWALPHASWTPSIKGEGAWTANGRTLAFEQRAVLRGRPRELMKGYRPPDTAQVRVLDTAAPGTSLASSKLLVLPAPAGESAPGQPIITPDGTKLIGPVATRSLAQRQQGELAVYSARTGALLRTLAPWVWRQTAAPGRGGFPSQTAAWSNRSGSQLVMLQPRDDLNVLGVLTGKKLTLTGSKLLPQQAPGYQELQYALRIAPQMTW